jgi:hypothetical protein
MGKRFFDLALNPVPSALSIFYALLFAFSVADHAQQPKKIPTVGFLLEGFPSSVSDSTRIDAFRQGLREIGYTEGKTFPSNTGSRREKEVASPIWQPSSSVSRWM